MRGTSQPPLPSVVPHPFQMPINSPVQVGKPQEAQGWGLAKITGGTCAAVPWATLVVSPEDSAPQPSLTRALTLLPSSGYSIRSICRSLAESGTSSTGRRLSPAVLTRKKGHFPQHKLERGLRESLGGLAMQGGRHGRALVRHSGSG